MANCGGLLRVFDLRTARRLRTGDVVETEFGTGVVERVEEPQLPEVDGGWVIARVNRPN